jgi:hypothetical protein
MFAVSRGCAWLALLLVCFTCQLANALSPVIHCQLDVPSRSFVVIEPPQQPAARRLPTDASQPAGGKRGKFVSPPLPQWAAQARWQPGGRSVTHVWVLDGEEETFVRSKKGNKVLWKEYHDGVYFATFKERSITLGQPEAGSVSGLYAVGDRLPVAHLFDESRSMHIRLNSSSAHWKTDSNAKWGRLGSGMWRTLPSS